MAIYSIELLNNIELLNTLLENIIKHYKWWHNENPDNWIEFCENQKDLETAIIYAVLAENQLGKRHSHQRRIKKELLEKYASILINKINQFKEAGDFEQIIKITDKCWIKGIGDLTSYDTANRIGAYLRIYPQKVYLHAGTRKGAEKLLRHKVQEKTINKLDLPTPLHKDNLACGEIEDILCIYKNKFSSEKK